MRSKSVLTYVRSSSRSFFELLRCSCLYGPTMHTVAITDGLLDALCHGQRVINERGCSRLSTYEIEPC